MSLEHEGAYLGCALADNAVLVNHPLKTEQFAQEKTRRLHEAMIAAASRGEKADLVTMHAACAEQPWYPGAAWLSNVADLGFSPGLAGSLAEQIRKSHRTRAVQACLSEAAAILKEDPEGAVERVEERLLVLMEGNDGERPFVTFDEAAKDWLGNLIDEKGEALRVETGDPDLDRDWILDCGGLHLIAGRPGMGKTSVALWVMQRMAQRGVPTIFFSLEMTAAQLVTKSVSEWTMIPANDLICEISDRYKTVSEELARRKGLKILITDAGGQTIERIAMVAQLARWRHGIGAIVVDYLQLVRTSKRSQNREQEVAHISGLLKDLAKTLKVPVIAVSQLNRNADGRADKRPMLSDLRESGSLEQNADSVALIYRPEYYLLQEGKAVPPEQKGFVELNIAKQRRIGPKMIFGKWRPEVNAFTWGRIETRRPETQRLPYGH